VPLFLDWLAAGFDVYTDTSWSRGFGPRWLIRELIEAGRPLSRLLLASDEPWGDLPSEVSKILNLDCEAAAKRAILYDNAATLYARRRTNARPGETG
jgi:predicted TIM-barrel fold metal-dependent hydrolase